MRCRCPIVLPLIVALATVVNLHLPALQVVAWTGMLIDYSRGNSLAEAVSMTFDGQHPCPMCREIQRQQTAPPDEVIGASPSPRIDAIIETVPAWVHTLVPLAAPVTPVPALTGFRPLPETPPPRSVRG